LERLPETQLKNLGRAIARLRVARGLTQEKLAEKADINTRYLQALEAGDFGGSLAVLRRVKKALECSWDELLGTL
jgi:transcriptional regulator with XRE-family HTH domain